MRLLLIFVTLTLGHCLAAPKKIAERVQTKSCEVGTTWKEECHSCFCTKEGKVSCSKEACPPQLVPKSKRSITNKDCKEGESWQEDCNKCYCSHDGKPVCTRMLCPSVLPLRESVHPTSDDDQMKIKREAVCVEGEVWKEDCHTCHCTMGRKACTRELCLSESDLRVTTEEDNQRTKRDDKSSSESSSSEEENCPPNLQTWEEDCNQCYCERGKKVCTKALCPDQGSVVAIEPK